MSLGHEIAWLRTLPTLRSQQPDIKRSVDRPRTALANDAERFAGALLPPKLGNASKRKQLLFSWLRATLYYSSFLDAPKT